MIKRNSPRPDTATNQTGRDISNTDDTVYTLEKKKVSRWTTVDIQLVELKDGKVQGYLIGDGVPYAVWYHVYHNFGMSQQHSVNLLKRLTDGTHYIRLPKRELEQYLPHNNVKDTWGYTASVYYLLTEEGYNRAIIEVDTSRMEDREAAANIERRKDEIAKVYTDFKTGRLSGSGFDIDSFGISNKEMSSLNGIRIRLQGMLARQRHPSNPDTVRRKIEMFRRDHRVLKGHDNMEQNWRPHESDERKIKLTGWGACGIYAFARGHLEPEEQSRDIKEFYATCPELRPDHLPDSIEPTRQTKLIGDGES